jgi:acetyl esterase/lipase
MSTDIQTRPAPPADQRIAYGPDHSQFGDLRWPAGPGPHPLAIVLHGGWWRSEVALDYLGHVCAALATEGIATWNLEFRRLGATGGGWPMTFQDVAAGADHVRLLAETSRIDLARVITLGHSAGGHLALWLAARQRIPVASGLHGTPTVPLRGAVSVAGAVDLRRLSQLGFRDGFVQRLVVDDLLGGTPAEVPERYAAGAPADLLPLGVRQILLQGTADQYTPAEVPTGYVQAATARGDEATLVWLEGADHFDPIDPLSRAYSPVRDAVRTLLA